MFESLSSKTFIDQNWLVSELFESPFIIKILLKKTNFNFRIFFAKIFS